MDKTKLEYFLSVVRHQSFTLAAQEHHVVTSTVSRQIAQLEAELETQLFRWDTRRVILTKAGQRLYENAHTYMSYFLNIDENIRNLMRQSEHRLHVSAGPYEFPLLIRTAAAFRQVDPQLELNPVFNRYRRFITQMRAGSIHLFFAVRRCAEQLPDCQTTSLGFHQWKAVARKDSPFWDLPPEQQRQFHGFNVIRSLQTDVDPIAPWLKRNGIEPQGWSIAGTFHMACVQAASGGGIALLPEYLEPWLSPELRMQQIFREPLVEESVLIFNPGSPNPHDKKFFEFVRDHYQP